MRPRRKRRRGRDVHIGHFISAREKFVGHYFPRPRDADGASRPSVVHRTAVHNRARPSIPPYYTRPLPRPPQRPFTATAAAATATTIASPSISVITMADAGRLPIPLLLSAAVAAMSATVLADWRLQQQYQQAAGSNRSCYQTLQNPYVYFSKMTSYRAVAGNDLQTPAGV